MGKRATGTEEAPKGLRTEDIVPLADTEKKKAPRKKPRTPEELAAYHDGQAKAYRLQQMEKARKKQKSAEEVESKGLLRQVIADWPLVPIEAKRCFAADIHEATAQ